MSAASPRIAWVDYAKGLCIILVVLMHATLGVEKATGTTTWLHGFIVWAQPFRMPDFFLISGLFLSRFIDRPWRAFLDSKLIHFGYFYLLWCGLQIGLKSPSLVQAGGLWALPQAFLAGLVEPLGTLWFIYLLALFFIVVKLLRQMNPIAVLAAAAVLQMCHIETGWLVIDQFASRFIYFYAGYAFCDEVFAFSDRSSARNVGVTAIILAAWAAINASAVASGVAQWPIFELVLGVAGAAAVVTAGVLLSKTGAGAAIRTCGQQSMQIYLAFFVFMAATRVLLLMTPLAAWPTLVALTATAAGVIGPLLLAALTRNTALKFLFERPQWAKLGQPRAAKAQRFAARLAKLQQPRIRLPVCGTIGLTLT